RRATLSLQSGRAFAPAFQNSLVTYVSSAKERTLALFFVFFVLMDIELVEFLDDGIHVFANSFAILLLFERVGHRCAHVCEDLVGQMWLEVASDLNVP